MGKVETGLEESCKTPTQFSLTKGTLNNITQNHITPHTNGTLQFTPYDGNSHETRTTYVTS